MESLLTDGGSRLQGEAGTPNPGDDELQTALRLDRDGTACVAPLHRNLTSTPTESGLQQGLGVQHAITHRAVLRRGNTRPILHGSRHHALCLIEEGELD